MPLAFVVATVTPVLKLHPFGLCRKGRPGPHWPYSSVRTVRPARKRSAR